MREWTFKDATQHFYFKASMVTTIIPYHDRRQDSRPETNHILIYLEYMLRWKFLVFSVLVFHLLAGHFYPSLIIFR